MSSRRNTGRVRALTIEDREHESALRARTALTEQTKGEFAIYGEDPLETARHNPLAKLGPGGLRFVEVVCLAAIAGIGFGYLVPNFTWPPQPQHAAALAGVLLACTLAILASQRLTENRQRILTAALHWKIADTGVFVSSLDAPEDDIAITFIPWSDVTVAESHRGRVVLIDAKGQILAELNTPTDAQQILRDIQDQRARRGEGNPGEVRGPRIEARLDARLEPRLDLPEAQFDRYADLSAGAPMDLDLLRAHVTSREPLREPLLVAQRRVEPQIVDADYIEVSLTPHDVIPEDLTDATPGDVEASDEPTIEPVSEEVHKAVHEEVPETVAAKPSDDTRPQNSASEAIEAETIDHEIGRYIDAGLQTLFAPIRADVVPQSVQDSHAATTRPVTLDESRVLPVNDDPVARSDDTVMRRLMEQLNPGVRRPDIDADSIVQRTRDFRRLVEEANINLPAPEPAIERVA